MYNKYKHLVEAIPRTGHTDDENTWADFRLAHEWLYSEDYKRSAYWPYNIPAIKVL